jgi:hypothetical protein
MRETDMNNPNIKYCMCDLCNEKIHPLDAHFGKLNGKLTTAHIDCWNNAKPPLKLL